MSDSLSVDLRLKVEYYDVDSMKIVWHGNYTKYYEQARCALFDLIGHNYQDMEDSGYAWPIVKIDMKYIKPLVFAQEFHIKATLMEFENRICIGYVIYDKENGCAINKGSTIQMAVNMKTGISQMVSPPHFVKCVHAALQKGRNTR